VARAESVGTRVHVAGVVTVVPGLVGADGLFAIQDPSGGIFVRVSTAPDALPIGSPIDVEGTLAAPYGQLEIRDVGSISVGDGLVEPDPSQVGLGDIGEQTEGSLVAITGTVESVQTDSGRLTVSIGDGAQAVRLLADPPTGLSRADVARGDVVLATGIVGQRATATGRLDGYRVWLRCRSDLIVSVPVATDSSEPSAAPYATSSESESKVAMSTSQPTGKYVYRDLASALATRGAAVDVEAVVTATAGLLDIGSPTIVIDDGTAAVAVTLAVGTEVPRVGMRVHVAGKVGRWEGGPTILASQVVAEGELAATVPRSVAGPLDSSLEWQLIQVCGRIDGYTPAGARWRLDVLVDGQHVIVLGEPAAAIAVTKASVGRMVVVVGIVRRSTSDSSAFQLLPRMAVDFRLGPSLGALDAVAPAGNNQAGSSLRSGAPSAGLGARNVDIGSLAGYLGRSVTVAGLVTDTASGTATIDDGTGQVRVGGPAAADALAILGPGDAIEVTGLVREDDLGLFIEADPVSILDLPGGTGDENVPSASGALDRIANRVPAATAVSRAPQASIRRASPGASPPDVPTLVLVALLALIAVAALLALGRNRAGLARRARRSSVLPTERLAAAMARWPGRGRRKVP